jgi:pimeloyl-ACP methyl ester carboxylesterase
MSTFGLVHGAYHGAWCWEPLISELEGRGDHALTVELPCEDRSAGASEYAAAALKAFAAADDDLVVVGHSLAGLTIPLLAQARPVRYVVYLCAMVARPGRAHNDVQQEEPDMVLPGPDGGAFEDPNGATRWHADAAARWFFADCPAEVAQGAARRLRGQYWTITEEVTPLRAWPDVPSVYILGARDPVLNPAWSRRISRDVLGVEPVELNVGHSPFLSAPRALADVLRQTTSIQLHD